MQFADIKNGIAFRKIFGNEQNTAPLIINKWTYFIKHAEELHVIPDFANEDEGLKTAFIEADKYQWSKEELKAYDNVTIREQDERGEREKAIKTAVALATQQAKEEKDIEFILGMKKEGFALPQIARVTQKSEEEIRKILDIHRGR